jgi:hypothetical protein
MQPRCIDRLLRRHSVVDKVHRRPEHRRDDPGAAEAAEHETTRPSFSTSIESGSFRGAIAFGSP